MPVRLLSLLLAVTLLTGCAGNAATSPADPVLPGASPTPIPTAAVFLPTPPSSAASPASPLHLWLENVPDGLRQQIRPTDAIQLAGSPGAANLRLAPAQTDQTSVSAWVYAVAAPFPTLVEEIRLQDVRNAWQGQAVETFGGKPLRVSADTRAVLETLLGPANPNGVQTVPAADLLETAWQQRPSWAILPFDALQPRWKVLRLDGQSPFDKNFNPDTYPLVARYALSGNAPDRDTLAQVIPATNRDPSRLTILSMTGVTALVRALAAKMNAQGMTYPAKEIRSWLADADLTHISNEVSFNTRCPTPNPGQRTLQFCSDPKTIELLEYVGTDIVELSGNHICDYGCKPLLYTLDLYRQRRWAFYAAGENLEKARQPITVEHNGNKLAFIGCNPAGPAHVWATDQRPGVADCDYKWMQEQIKELRQAGYLPIATFQYFESYDPRPLPQHRRDFEAIAAAGAVIVSGSQSHIPQAMSFYGDDQFIHYGLGNLFFDQMGVTTVNGVRLTTTRNGFIDRHIFYDGRYLGTELLTTRLEDYALLRPMSSEERNELLTSIFKASGW